VSKVGIAYIAQNFGAYHAMTAVDALSDIIRIKRAKVTWPTATGIKLRVGLEKWRTATDANIDPFFMVIPIATGKGAFRGGMPCYLILNWIELGTPFRFAFNHFVCHDEQLTSSSLAQSGGNAA
jgi:hypothetical protein